MLMIVGHDRTTDRTRHRQARRPAARHGRGGDHLHRRRPRRSARASSRRSARSPRWPTSASAAHEREPQPADPRLRPARQPRRPRVRRLGPDLAERARGRRARAGVLDERDLDADRRASSKASSPMDAVFDQRWVKKLDGADVKNGAIEDGPGRGADRRHRARSRAENGCDRLVMVWCGSTEVYREPSRRPRVASRRSSRASKDNDVEHRAVADLRLRRAARCGVPYANGAPNLSVDLPCMLELRASATACRSPARTSRPARR